MVKHYLGIGVVGLLAAIAACSSGSNGGSGNCSTLKTCCAQLSDASSQTACTNVVALNDTPTCASAQDDFVSNKLCAISQGGGGGGGGTGCTGLSACCASLGGAAETECDTYVTAAGGNDATCSAELEAFQSAGMCASGGSGSGSGVTLTGCSGLSTCCSSVPSEYTESCNAVVATGVDASCTAEISAYETAGYCGSARTSFSIGGSSSSGGGGGTGCSGLSSCCGSVPSEYTASCNAVVSAGVDASCSEELTAYQTDGYCGGGSGGSSSSSAGGGGGGTGCSGLSACCSSVPSEYTASCNAVVSSGVDASCSEELTAYQTDGYCGGGGSGSGGGTGSGGGCSALSSCCSSLPSSEAPGCNEIVTEGSDTVCSEEITAYQEQGYCK